MNSLRNSLSVSSMRFQVWKEWLPLSLGIVLLAVFSWSFFYSGFFRVHDYTHVARIVEMKRAFVAGQFPVHWTQNFGYGYGMPLFLFYGSIPFYFATLLTLLGLSALNAMRLMFLMANILSFVGMYLLTRRWGRFAAITAATLFLAAPYRAVDIYVRGAINEVWAIAWLPWLLWAAWQIPQHPKRGFTLTALFTALIIMTHNLTAFIGLPILGVLTLGYLWLHHREWKHILTFIGAGVWGAVLAVGYLVPAFVEKEFTIIESILSGYFDYRHHFLYIRQFFIPQWGYNGSVPGPGDEMSFHVGLPFLTLIMIGTWLILQRWFRRIYRLKRHHHWPITIKLFFNSITSKEWLFGGTGILLVFSLAMTLYHAQPIWEAIELLSFVQFPWRFLSVAITLAAVMSALAVSFVDRRSWRYAVMILFILGALFGQEKYHQPEKFLDRAEDFYYTDEATIRRNMSDILPDYIPAGFDRQLPPVDPEQRIVLQDQNVSGQLETNVPHQVLWLGQAPIGTKITWNIADFPGWEYSVNDEVIDPEKLADGRKQFIATTPVTSVGARFTHTPIRQVSLAISAVAWFIWLWAILPQPRRAKERNSL